MENVKEVDIVLENCDVITLSPEEIDYLNFTELSYDISSINDYKPIIYTKSFIQLAENTRDFSHVDESALLTKLESE